MYTTTNELIFSMYEDIEYITADFVLVHDINVVANGIAVIGHEDYDSIRLNIHTFNVNNIKKMYKEGGDVQTIIINASSNIPSYFKCELTNFTKNSRKNEFDNKEIIIKFDRVKIDYNVTLSLQGNNHKIECAMTPLYNLEGKLLDIIIQ